MKRFLLALAVAAGLLFAAPPVQAQTCDPDVNPEDCVDPPPDVDKIPLDGGITLLAAAGAGYALHKLRKRGDDEDDEEAMP